MIGRGGGVKSNSVEIHHSYLCIGFSQLWRKKIHSVIKRFRNAHGLKWPRVRFSYHKFRNLGEILQSDLVRKIRKGVESKYLLNCEFNCNSTTKVKFTCACGGECRTFCVFYKVTCRQCLSVYVVITPKKRTERHFQDVAQKVRYNKSLDTFAARFDRHLVIICVLIGQERIYLIQ